MEEIKCSVCEKSPTAYYPVCVDCYERIWDAIAGARKRIEELKQKIERIEFQNRQLEESLLIWRK